MVFNIDCYTFEFLSVAKDLYDYGLLDKVLKTCGNMEVCEDYYSLTWEGIYQVFECFRQYYNEETGIDTMVFFDPVITEFYRLCAMYEARRNIRKDRDLFRDEMEKAVYRCFCLDSYDFDVLLCDGTHGSPRLVILSGEEFYGHSELPGVLSEVRNTFMRLCGQIKEMLVTEDPGANTPGNAEKEAA